MKTRIRIWYKANPNHLPRETFFCDSWKLIHETKILQISKNDQITSLINFNEIIKMESEEIE